MEILSQESPAEEEAFVVGGLPEDAQLLMGHFYCFQRYGAQRLLHFLSFRIQFQLVLAEVGR